MAIIPSANNKSQFSKKKSEYTVTCAILFVFPTGDGRIIRIEETRTITNTLSHLLVEPCHKEEKKRAQKRQGQHHLPTYMIKYHSYKTWECLEGESAYSIASTAWEPEAFTV